MRSAVLLTGVWLFGCGGGSPPDRVDADAADGGAPDAHRTDGGAPDADPPDAGPPRRDAGAPDAGGERDGGRELDAGDTDSGVTDSGAPDAGAPDSGPVDCTYERVDTSMPPLAVSWRYGGGVGYPDRPPSAPPCAVVVDDFVGLRRELLRAEPGDVVYVADDAEIDLSRRTLCIGAGVTLASGRGRGASAGALLYSTFASTTPILEACGDDVRITGLRLRGPDHCIDCTSRAAGIRLGDDRGGEIDNNELTGWSGHAIIVVDRTGVRVHHNHIHHNRRDGLGYGVVLGGEYADVLVDWNRFDDNRHSIASSGSHGHRYEARDNLVLPNANGHVFDVHGVDEDTGVDPAAGERFVVHRNTILPLLHHAFVVRGRPTDGAWVHDNCVSRSRTEAFEQRRFFGNFHVDVDPGGAASPNRYGASGADCERVFLCTSRRAEGPWETRAATALGLDTLGLGDFDGDGRTDVFHADGTTWSWLAEGRGRFEELARSAVPRASVHLGDFDGDGRADVFRATGTAWRLSAGGTAPFTTLRRATERLGEIGFGDFDGDGRLDAFRADGTDWRVSWGASGDWEVLSGRPVPLSDLGFADFDGDGADDVFYANGSLFRYSSGGTETFTPLRSSTERVGSLALVDVDADGVADVLRADGTRWWVSWSGSSAWEVLAIRNEALSDVRFGDFDADGAADAFMTGCL